jgi:hypothetical protein
MLARRSAGLASWPAAVMAVRSPGTGMVLVARRRDADGAQDLVR